MNRKRTDPFLAASSAASIPTEIDIVDIEGFRIRVVHVRDDAPCGTRYLVQLTVLGEEGETALLDAGTREEARALAAAALPAFAATVRMRRTQTQGS
jgi:hypothetical protein